MASLRSLQIRVARPAEYAALGELTVGAYASVDPSTLEGDYPDELRDVAGRAAGADVLVAVDLTVDTGAAGRGGGADVPVPGDAHDSRAGVLLGGVTYVPGPDSPSAEFAEPDAAGIRMLAVDPGAHGRGVGEALTRACIDRARATGRRQVLLHSTDRMTAAHRLYRRLGFVREPSLDWEPEPGVDLRGFRLRLAPP